MNGNVCFNLKPYRDKNKFNLFYSRKNSTYDVPKKSLRITFSISGHVQEEIIIEYFERPTYRLLE